MFLKPSESFFLLIHGQSMKDKGHNLIWKGELRFVCYSKDELIIISAVLKQGALYMSHSWQWKDTWAELS